MTSKKLIRKICSLSFIILGKKETNKLFDYFISIVDFFFTRSDYHAQKNHLILNKLMLKHGGELTNEVDHQSCDLL